MSLEEFANTDMQSPMEASQKMAVSVNTLQRYEQKVKRLQEELAAATEVIEILKRNLDIDRLLVAMEKVRL